MIGLNNTTKEKKFPESKNIEIKSGNILINPNMRIFRLDNIVCD